MMPILHLYSAVPDEQQHGPDGPTHVATVRYETEYDGQLADKIAAIDRDHPSVVRIRCLDLDCEWAREDDILVPRDMTAARASARRFA